MMLLTVLILAAGESACAQGSDFFELAMMGTPQGVAAALAQGAEVNAWGKDSLTPNMFAAEHKPGHRGDYRVSRIPVRT